MRTGRVWLIIIVFLLGLVPAALAATPDIRENLEYQISLGP
jgi:hypothetical protein